jgi:hypothetical protein
MRIGLIDIEPKIENTALMQISYHHKDQGDTVEWADPAEYDKYGRLYCSSLFKYTDKSKIPDRTICGGTGFDLTTELPFDCEYDYSIYPKCKASFMWFSRGCDRKCPWCVVPKKEGAFHLVKHKMFNPNGRYIKIMDNSFFSNPDWRNVISWIGTSPVDIQGIDIHTLTGEMCKALNGLKRWKNRQFHIAWDRPNEDLVPKLKEVFQYIRPYKLMCYVLIGYNSTEAQDLHRIETLRNLKVDPFVMPFDKFDRYQKNLARYVNAKEIFRTATWAEYKAGKAKK